MNMNLEYCMSYGKNLIKVSCDNDDDGVDDDDAGRIFKHIRSSHLFKRGAVSCVRHPSSKSSEERFEMLK